MDQPDRSLFAAFDILYGLMQGLGMELEQHIMGSQPNIFELLINCMKHPYAAVRQSGYALVGGMSKNCFPLLRPQVSRIMQCVTVQLDPGPKVEFVSACNNAAWAAGEIALRFGRGESISELVQDVRLNLFCQMRPNSGNGFTPLSRSLSPSCGTRRPRRTCLRTPRCRLAGSV